MADQKLSVFLINGIEGSFNQIMKKYLPLIAFLITEISVLSFIIVTVSAMPEMVASHFNEAGVPNGFISRTDYFYFMVAFSVGIPSLVSAGMVVITSFAQDKLNIPHRVIWLSDKYKEDTLSFLRAHSLGLGALISLFLAYVHWLVLKANRAEPTHLASESIILALVVFGVAMLLWGQCRLVKQGVL